MGSSRRSGDGHILLGVLHDKGFASVQVLTAMGVQVEAVRADVTRLITAEAA